MAHELVHYRFPYMQHERKFEPRVDQVVRGRRFEPKHIHLFANCKKRYRQNIDGDNDGNENNTESNDTVYETNFETGRVKEIRTNYHGNPYSSSIDYPLEEKLSKVKSLSIIPIRNAQDIYHALTDRQTLDKVLEQGLDEKNLKYKDDLLNFFMSIKDNVRVEDLVITSNSYDATINSNTSQQYAKNKCSICQGFANIYCVICSSKVWLCVDHWREHKANNHRNSMPIDKVTMG